MGETSLKDVQEKISVSKTSKYRKLLSLLVRAAPSIREIGEWDDNGFITFSVRAKDMGLTDTDYSMYINEIFSYFIIDALGELILRENISVFADKLKELDVNDYMTAISEEEHGHIGMESKQGKFIFTFHISLLRNILTENFKYI